VREVQKNFFAKEKRKKSLKLIKKNIKQFFAFLLAYKQSFLILNTNYSKRKKVA